MKWPTVALGDVCDVIAGGTPKRSSPQYWGGGIPWVKISDMLQVLVTSTDETISKAGLDNSAAKLLPAGTLLISIFATIGRTAVLGCDAATNQAIVGVIPKRPSTLDKRFLLHSLNHGVSDLQKQARGVAQANINGSVLKALQFALPPLPEQKRIAAILDAADALRVKRRESIEQLDSLVQATFLEMFGDPVTNPKGWRQAALQQTGTHSKVGPFGSLLHKADYITGGVPLVNPKHIRQGKIEHGGDETVLVSKAEELSEYRLKCGDVLMGRRGEMGRCTVIQPTQEQWLCGTGSVLLRTDKRTLTPLYLCSLLSSQPMRRHLEHLSGGAIMPSLSGSQVQSLVISLPPIDLQARFAAIVESIEHQKAQLKSHHTELAALFSSLQSRAFNGELVA